MNKTVLSLFAVATVAGVGISILSQNSKNSSSVGNSSVVVKKSEELGKQGSSDSFSSQVQGGKVGGGQSSMQERSSTVKPELISSFEKSIENSRFKALLENAKMIEASEVASSGGPQPTRRSYLMKSDFTYPHLKVENEVQVNSATGEEEIVSQKTIVADHVIATAQSNVSHEMVEVFAKENGVEVRYNVPNSAEYLISSKEVALETTQKLEALVKANPEMWMTVDEDEVTTVSAVPNDTSFSNQWGLNKDVVTGVADLDMNAPEAWNISQGSKSVVVGVIDTGVNYNHPDLAANMWKNPGEIPGNGVDDDKNGYIDDVYGYNFLEKKSAPTDGHGHGTHCAGIIGAVGNNGAGVTGVCWNVSIMALKVGDNSGYLSGSAIREAMTYANKMGATITSNSYVGANPYLQIDEASKKGNIFVCAAGNDGLNLSAGGWSLPSILTKYGASSYDYSGIFSVAAYGTNGKLASWSNYGSDVVHIAAPGVGIYSTLKTGGYGNMSGTSMAAPMVAGAAALLKSIDSSLNAVQIKEILMSTATVTPELNSKVICNGRMNLYKAVQKIYVPKAKTYAGWVEQYKLTGDSAMEGANPARDGVPNLLKYALGMNPGVASRQVTDGATVGLPKVTVDGNSMTITYQKDKSKSDITYEVQVSKNMGGWTKVVGGETVKSSSMGVDTVSVSVPVSGNDKMFMRLKVIR